MSTCIRDGVTYKRHSFKRTRTSPPPKFEVGCIYCGHGGDSSVDESQGSQGNEGVILAPEPVGGETGVVPVV